MIFAGVDQSLNHTGLCLLESTGKLHRMVLIEPKQTGHARLAYIRDALREVFEGTRCKLSVLEGYSMGSVSRKFDLGEVGAIVKLALFDASDAVYVAAPKQLKKFVTANGSASKEGVMEALRHQWGVDIKNDNLADAYGLAQIARGLALPDTLKRHQLDVLNDIRGTKLKVGKPARVRVPNAFKDSI